MMTIFAQDLLSTLRAPSPTPSQSAPPAADQNTTASRCPPPSLQPAIDIGITKLPYFADKAASIQASGSYGRSDDEATQPEQVHLTGFDTLLRLLDTKYYPPSHTLTPLEPFLGKHRVRVTYRSSSGSSDWRRQREEQDKYLRELSEGKREKEGGKAKWGTEGRIVLVDGRPEGEGQGDRVEAVSSTRVREAVKRGNKEALRRLVTEGVAEWVVREGLYLDE